MAEFKNKSKQSAGKIVWIAWSIAMIMLLSFSVDRIFEFHLFSFEVFISIICFFIIVLLLINLGWILVIRNRHVENHEKLTAAFDRLMKELEQLNDK
jgi:hypothetical protein